MLRTLRNFLIAVPNFPNAAPGLDTQPFFLVALWSEYRLHPVNVIVFCALATAGIAEYFLRAEVISPTDPVILTVFFALMCLVDWRRAFLEQFYRNLPVLVAVIVALTLLRALVPALEGLFSPRDDVLFVRSYPLVYPEGSYAAKTFFLFYIGFALALRRFSMLLIAAQFATFSATGIFTGMICILYYLIVQRRMRALRLIAAGIAGLLALLLLRGDDVVGLLAGSGNARALVAAGALFGAQGGVVDFLLSDHSLNTRLGAIAGSAEVGNLSSIAAYALELPLTFTLAGAVYIWAVLIRRSAGPADAAVRLGALFVAGYADSFVYPAAILALNCRAGLAGRTAPAQALPPGPFRPAEAGAVP